MLELFKNFPDKLKNVSLPVPKSGGLRGKKRPGTREEKEQRGTGKVMRMCKNDRHECLGGM